MAYFSQGAWETVSRTQISLCHWKCDRVRSGYEIRVYVQSTRADKKNLFISSPTLSIIQLVQLTDTSLSEVNIAAQQFSVMTSCQKEISFQRTFH